MATQTRIISRFSKAKDYRFLTIRTVYHPFFFKTWYYLQQQSNCIVSNYFITGDLRAIENDKLRELVAKGPKYREPNRVNWKATETMFLESIDLYAKNWSKREQVELKYLS